LQDGQEGAAREKSGDKKGRIEKIKKKIKNSLYGTDVPIAVRVTIWLPWPAK
jgi:hypothetical protein